MPVNPFTPPPVPPPRGPRPSPSMLAQVPHEVSQPPELVRRACQKSHDSRAAKSTTTIPPSEPLFGAAPVGM